VVKRQKKTTVRKPKLDRQGTLIKRNFTDSYTNENIDEIEQSQKKYEVDHIVEVQLLDWIFQKFEQTQQIITRNELKEIIRIFNSTNNLNVTQKWINNGKRSPFTRFLSAYKKNDEGPDGIDAYVIHRSAHRLVNEGYWKKIKQEVSNAFRDLLGDIEQSCLPDHHKKNLTNEMMKVRDALKLPPPENNE